MLILFVVSVNARVHQLSVWPIVAYRALSVIPMFGVFTHAQLDHGGFWDTLGQQLQQGGAEYVERCTFRNKPLSPGDNVISPAIFPPLPIQETPHVDPPIKASEEDIETVSDINDGKEFFDAPTKQIIA